MKKEHIMALLLSFSALGFGEDQAIDSGSPIASHLHQVTCIETLVSSFEPPPHLRSSPPELSGREVNALMGIANIGIVHAQIFLRELARGPVESDAKKLREALDEMTRIQKRIQTLLDPYIK